MKKPSARSADPPAGPRASRSLSEAEVYVTRFEDLASKQLKLQESKREPKKLAEALAAAIHFANASHDRALQTRIVKAARPLIQSSSLFKMEDAAWAVSVDGKVYSLGKCIDSCRANNPPGVARELCETGCALWIFFCGGSEPPDQG